GAVLLAGRGPDPRDAASAQRNPDRRRERRDPFPRRARAVAPRVAAARHGRAAAIRAAAEGGGVRRRARGLRPGMAARGDERMIPAPRLRSRPATRMVAGPGRQRGVAVLTAMLVVAIGTVIAVNLMWEATLDQRRTLASLAADQ